MLLKNSLQWWSHWLLGRILSLSGLTPMYVISNIHYDFKKPWFIWRADKFNNPTLCITNCL